MLPAILPSSPPSSITMDSIARLRAQIQEFGEEWDMDKNRFFRDDQKLINVTCNMKVGRGDTESAWDIKSVGRHLL